MRQPLNGKLAPLVVGTVAPDFTLPNTPYTRLRLWDLRGQPVVLVFYPCDWEPVSREQLTLYQDYADKFLLLHTCLLGISIDTAWSHEAFSEDAHIRFPLLADFQPRGAVARAYGIYHAALGVSARALFVLDHIGIIRFSQTYSNHLNPGVDGLLTALEALTEAEDPTNEG